MEYLEGHSLFHRLQEQGPMPVLGAVNIVRQIVSALSLAHEMGVIHRDLKPENVFLLRRPGRRRVVRRMAEADQTQPRFEVEDEGDFDLVKLLDFGLAKVLMDTSVSATDPNMILGTPAYLAPEQINGPSVDGRTDIYALGILLYEMITGSPPFGGTSVALLRAHVSQQALPPEQMNPDVEIDANTSNTILRCLRKEPRRRFQTMDELDQALAGFFVDRVYLREAANMPGAEDAGVVVPPRPPSEARKPREQTITDELQELFQGSQDGLEQKLEQALDGPPVAPAPPEPEVVVEQVQEQEQEEWKKTKETLPYRSLKR